MTRGLGIGLSLPSWGLCFLLGTEGEMDLENHLHRQFGVDT